MCVLSQRGSYIAHTPFVLVSYVSVLKHPFIPEPEAATAANAKDRRLPIAAGAKNWSR